MPLRWRKESTEFSYFFNHLLLMKVKISLPMPSRPIANATIATIPPIAANISVGLSTKTFEYEKKELKE